MEQKSKHTPKLNRGQLFDDVIVRREPVAISARAHAPKLVHIQSSEQTIKPEKTSNKKAQTVLISAAVLIFGLGITASIMSFRTNHEVISQVNAVSNKNDENVGDHPDETVLPDDAVDSYKVAPDLPRKISIPEAGVAARVLSLGVKSNNELMAPANIYDTGWYQGSAKPGDTGATLIDGHVHGLTKPGVFYSLKNLKNGSVITIERGDGRVLTYKVVRMQTYTQDKVDMAAALVSAEPGKSGLNLITCAGKFNKATQQYEDRLVVFAVQTS